MRVSCRRPPPAPSQYPFSSPFAPLAYPAYAPLTSK